MESGRRRQALALAQDAARLNPRDPLAAAMPATALLAQGDLAAADGALAALRAQYPKSASVLTLEGRLHVAHGRDAAARTVLQQSLQLRPDHAETLLEVARLDIKSGRGRDASRRLHEVAARHPTDAGLSYAAATVWSLVGDADRSRTELRRTLDLNPAQLQAALDLVALDRRRAPAEATRVLEALIARRPRAIQARMALGTLYESAGRTADARAQYEVVLVERDQPELAALLAEAGSRLRALGSPGPDR